MHGQRRRKPTEYCIQLREKQKVRSIYGMLERQFRGTFRRAERMKGVTGDNLLMLLECRLDNATFRAGFAVSRNDGRQLVRHGHVKINGRRVNIPSFQVKEGDEIEIKPKSKGLKRIAEAVTQAERRPAVSWIEADYKNMKASVTALPGRAEFEGILPGHDEEGEKKIREEFIVELYSK